VTESFFDEHFNINVKGLYFTVQGVLPLMPDGGSILLTSSVAGKKGFQGSSVYSATKAAVRSLGRTLAAELAPRRIRVNNPQSQFKGFSQVPATQFRNAAEHTQAVNRIVNGMLGAIPDLDRRELSALEWSVNENRSRSKVRWWLHKSIFLIPNF
jgi:NAD(P)-dependent dehydrogenase (short-subunit alcohol dehydrogenase family)